MSGYTVTIAPSALRTRILLTHGGDELLRAVLPPPSRALHERSAATLLEGLSLWLDASLRVVLSVAEKDSSFCLGLTDELGCGLRSLYYAVEVTAPRGRRRGRRIGGVGDFADLRQLALVPPGGDDR
jgi:hypothetical protein